MTDPLQTAGRCSDKQISFESSFDVDQDGVGRESVAGVQFTSWGDHQPVVAALDVGQPVLACLLYTSPSPRDTCESRMPSSA